MLEKTKLEEISLELPERERRELLARISRSLDAGQRDELVRVELKQEERERLLAEDMGRLSTWARLLLWLRRLFTGKNRRELFMEWKIGELKRTIRQHSAGLTGFETRSLSPKLARLLWELYAAAFPLRGPFQAFHGDGEFRERAILDLFERRHAEARKILEDFASQDEMERVFADTGSEEEVRKLLRRRVDEYLRRLSERMLHQLNEGLRPFFYLKNLVLFPYGSVFRLFKAEVGSRPPDKVPEFEAAAAMLLLEQLERLYHAVSLPLELGEEWFCHEEIFRYYEEWKRDPEEPEAPAAEQAVYGAEELTRTVLRLADAARQFGRKVPLLELIRYFRKDPYYRITYGQPRFHLRPVYAAALRRQLAEELEGRITQVKKNVVERKIADVFDASHLVELLYYTSRPAYEYQALDLPYLSYTTSLKVLYNYLARVYKGTIQEVVQLVNMYVLGGNRIAQSRLNQYAAGLEELEAKVILLDRSLDPDEDDGRTLTRLRHHLATDLTQQKLYRAFVAQKDKEARELIDTGGEQLLGVKRIFDELLESPVQHVKAVLRTLHFHKGKNVTLSGLLRGTSDMVGEFHDLLSQLLELEKGS
jgi:hypothetical protein